MTVPQPQQQPTQQVQQKLLDVLNQANAKIEQLEVEKKARKEGMEQMLEGNTQLRAATMMQGNQIEKGNARFEQKLKEVEALQKKLLEQTDLINDLRGVVEAQKNEISQLKLKPAVSDPVDSDCKGCDEVEKSEAA